MTRREFAALLPATHIAAAQSASSPFFPVGCHVYREPHLPLDQLRRDLPLLRKIGFNFVKVQESWAIDEKREGVIDFSTIHEVLSLARENGLRVYFGVTMEQAPAWLWRKFPDAAMVYDDGSVNTESTQYLLPSDGKPGPCWHHPGARAAAIRFLERAAMELSRHDHILFWNLWQEIGYWHLRAGRSICYCPNSLAAFRSWLQQRYSSVEKLNAAWRTGFGVWEDVHPPRSFSQVPSYFDWREFIDDFSLAETLRWKGEPFRRLDPLHRPVMAHLGWPEMGSTAEWRQARAVDIYGSSAYPSWGSRDHDLFPAGHWRNRYSQFLDGVLSRFDYVRSASVNGEFWTAEIESGRASGGYEPGRVPDAADIRLWTLGTLATGSRGVCFWNHRPEPFWTEAHGFGLLDWTGDSTPRAAEASRIARALQPHAELFTKGSCPPADLAILVDGNLWKFLGAEGPAARARYNANLRGLYRIFWESGYTVDFLDSSLLPSLSRKPRVIYAPSPFMLPQAVVGSLVEFVRSGGLLVSEAAPARVSDFGFGSPGELPESLEALFGAVNDEFLVMPQDAKPVLVSAAGARVRPSWCLHFVKPRAARPLLTLKGRVAATSMSQGKGSAVLLGTLLGLDDQESPASPNFSFLPALLASHDCRPASPKGALKLRKRVHLNKEAWFLFNTGEQLATQTLPIPAATRVSDLLAGPLPSRTLTVPPMDVRCLILEKS